MSAYTPEPGQLFYAQCTRRYRRDTGGLLGGGIATAQVYEVQDRSWHDEVFRCVAVDSRMVAAEHTVGYFANDKGRKPTLLDRSEFAFHPVGPDIAKALGLEVDTGETP